MQSVSPYTVSVERKIIDQVYQRVLSYPWDALISVDGWDYGSDPSYMKELCEYWVNDFDWFKQEEKINKFDHYKTSIENVDIHFIYE